jgi:hypothetical protein
MNREDNHVSGFLLFIIKPALMLHSPQLAEISLGWFFSPFVSIF